MYRGVDLVILRNRLESILPADKYRHKKFKLFLQAGGNDCDKLPSDEVISRYKKLIDAIRHMYPHAEIIVGQIPDRESDQAVDHVIAKKNIGRVNSYLVTRSIMRHDIKFADVCPKSLDHLRRDKVHFNPTGKALFAQKLHSFLNPPVISHDTQGDGPGSKEQHCAERLMTRGLTHSWQALAKSSLDFHRVQSKDIT